MPLAGGGRFAPQILSAGPHSHLQNSHLQHHPNQHQPPGSAGLPPPFSNQHHTFNYPNSNSVLNPFAPTNGTNGLAAGFGGGGGLDGGGGTGLASRAAQGAFNHGAVLQQQQQAREAIRRGSGTSKAQNKNRIREVWQGNLAQEMAVIRDLVDRYPYIAMDTEFPGVVARPMGKFTTKQDYHYQTLRCNVDILNVIQLGLTLFSKDGEMPPAHGDGGFAGTPYQNSLVPCPHTWQFNFRFSMNEHMHNAESIDFLVSVGMNLDMHEREGIDPHEFGSLLISSGLVLTDDVRWISFHSGYDFGYLVKIMLCSPLPDEEGDYRKLLNIFFPAIYDIKFMIKNAVRTQMATESPLIQSAVNILSNLGTKSSLQDLADELGIKRIGVAHHAGSDSLVTGRLFWEVKKSIFNGNIDDTKYLGQIWGLHELSDSSSGSAVGRFDNQTTPNMNGVTMYSANGTPSTPNTTHIGLAQTPNQQPTHVNGGGMGSLTPGNGAGVFGQFRFAKG